MRLSLRNSLLLIPVTLIAQACLSVQIGPYNLDGHDGCGVVDFYVINSHNVRLRLEILDTVIFDKWVYVVDSRDGISSTFSRCINKSEAIRIFRDDIMIGSYVFNSIDSNQLYIDVQTPPYAWEADGDMVLVD